MEGRDGCLISSKKDGDDKTYVASDRLLFKELPEGEPTSAPRRPLFFTGSANFGKVSYDDDKMADAAKGYV